MAVILMLKRSFVFFCICFRGEQSMINGNHPYLNSALKRLQECNVIKYAAYRTAAKLRVLQRTLSSTYPKAIWNVFLINNNCVIVFFYLIYSGPAAFESNFWDIWKASFAIDRKLSAIGSWRFGICIIWYIFCSAKGIYFWFRRW